MGNIFSFLRSKKFIALVIIIFALFIIIGYIAGTFVSYQEKWFGTGPTFWNALKPF